MAPIREYRSGSTGHAYLQLSTSSDVLHPHSLIGKFSSKRLVERKHEGLRAGVDAVEDLRRDSQLTEFALR
jgi:hypothetical protein